MGESSRPPTVQEYVLTVLRPAPGAGELGSAAERVRVDGEYITDAGADDLAQRLPLGGDGVGHVGEDGVPDRAQPGRLRAIVGPHAHPVGSARAGVGGRAAR